MIHPAGQVLQVVQDVQVGMIRRVVNLAGRWDISG
jgi:hypothetical protein